jgi:hypothetical protein
MTPQERQLIGELFDRLASLENGPRDPDAEAMIREGFRRAPNAAYSLVQTVLVQDEALKAANAHIQELERATGAQPQAEHPRGFLDSMRESIFGRDEPRGSVPRVPQGGYRDDTRGDPWGRDRDGRPASPGYSQSAGYGQPQSSGYGQPQAAGGPSFLGTAAAAAAGVIGGSLLMNGIRSAFAGHQAGPFAGAFDQLSGRDPGGDLSRDAGYGDIGGRGGPFSLAQQDAQQDAEQDAQDDADEAQDFEQDAGDFDDSDMA